MMHSYCKMQKTNKQKRWKGKRKIKGGKVKVHTQTGEAYCDRSLK